MNFKRAKYQYIDREFYEAQLNVDLIAEDQEAEFHRAVYYASALINAFTGNRVEGWENLTTIQQGGVKEARVFQVAHFLNSGELDGQRGTAAYSGGGQSFTFNMPGEGNKTLRIDEKAIFALQQEGLLNTVIGIDPIKAKADKREKEPKKHIYHRWGVEALDDSLFVSDGTTEDGGKVRLKISDPYQAEINEVSHIGKVRNHLVYRENIVDAASWNSNALIHKGYIDQIVPNYKNIRREFERFKKWRVALAEQLEEWRNNLKEKWDKFKHDLAEQWKEYKEELERRFIWLRGDLEQFIDDELDFKKADLEEWAKNNLKGEKGDKGPKGDTPSNLIDINDTVMATDNPRLVDEKEASKYIIKVSTTNPWHLAHYYISYLNTKLHFYQHQLVTDGYQWQYFAQDKELFHYANYRVRPFMPPDEVKELESMKLQDENEWNIISIGLPGVPSGGVYANLLKHISRLTQPGDTYSCGIDFGFVHDPLAVVLISTQYNVWNSLDLIAYFKNQSRYTCHQLAYIIVRWLKSQAVIRPALTSHGLNVYCDKSNFTFIEVLNRESEKQAADQWLKDFSVPQYEVLARIAFKQGLIGANKLNISLTTNQLLTELATATWDKKSIGSKPKLLRDIPDHAMDAFDYAMTPWYQAFLQQINPHWFRKQRVGIPVNFGGRGVA